MLRPIEAVWRSVYETSRADSDELSPGINRFEDPGRAIPGIVRSPGNAIGRGDAVITTIAVSDEPSIAVCYCIEPIACSSRLRAPGYAVPGCEDHAAITNDNEGPIAEGDIAEHVVGACRPLSPMGAIPGREDSPLVSDDYENATTKSQAADPTDWQWRLLFPCDTIGGSQNSTLFRGPGRQGYEDAVAEGDFGEYVSLRQGISPAPCIKSL